MHQLPVLYWLQRASQGLISVDKRMEVYKQLRWFIAECADKDKVISASLMLSLIPVLGVLGEQKTKPTKHSVRELRALGLTPHFLACCSAEPLLEGTKQKLSQFCHVPDGNILNIPILNKINHNHSSFTKLK